MKGKSKITTPLSVWLKQRGLSKAWLARQLGVSPTSAGNWVDGLKKPNRHKTALKGITGLSFDDLVNYDEDPVNPLKACRMFGMSLQA